jgi:hypothetical protein
MGQDDGLTLGRARECRSDTCNDQRREENMARFHSGANDPSSATRRTGRVDCNHDAHTGFAAAQG